MSSSVTASSLLWGGGGFAGASPSCLWARAGYTLDKSPAHRRALTDGLKRNSSPKNINSTNVVVPEQGVRWWSSCSPQLSGWEPELWGQAPLAGCRWSDDGTGRWDCLLYWCEPTQPPRISSLLSGLWLQTPIVHLYSEIKLYNMFKKCNSLRQSTNKPLRILSLTV